MRKRMVLLSLLIASAAMPRAFASDDYKVQVTRVDQDLYKIEGVGKTMYIKTAYCYEYATWEEAVLILNVQPFQGSTDIGKIVFDDGESCQVDTILQ